jgi:hypothetical protein
MSEKPSDRNMPLIESEDEAIRMTREEEEEEEKKKNKFKM